MPTLYILEGDFLNRRRSDERPQECGGLDKPKTVMTNRDCTVEDTMLKARTEFQQVCLVLGY
jgi:hypothetical protein